MRKRQAAPDRTTFVCYVCAVDCPSSQLRLVYCCANAEREPYYPFIKTKSAPPNASPISPQGMVQICVSCNQQNMHLAEGATPGANPSSSDDRLVQFSNSIMTSQQSQREQVPIHVPSSNVPTLQSHNISMTSATNPSSLVPSKSSVHDSNAANVRYKVSTKFQPLIANFFYRMNYFFSPTTHHQILPKINFHRNKLYRRVIADVSLAVPLMVHQVRLKTVMAFRMC